MKKSELKTGMIVECNNGAAYLVQLNHFRGRDMLLNLSRESKLEADGYNEDLTSNDNDVDFNIIRVHESNCLFLPLKVQDCHLIWERKKEIPEYTMEELIEKLGEEFKIKK